MKGKFGIFTVALELVCMLIMKSYSNSVGNKVRPAGSRLRELDGHPVVRLDERGYNVSPLEEEKQCAKRLQKPSTTTGSKLRDR